MKIQRLFNSRTQSGSILWLSLLGFLRPAINIFLIPLYLLRLTPDDYGVIAMVLAITGIIAMVFSFRLDTAVRTYYFDFEGKELKAYISQIFSASLYISILVFTVFYFLGAPLYDLVFTSDQISYTPFGQIALATALLNACNTIFFIYLKNSLKVDIFVGYSLFSIALTVLLQGVLILYFGWTILGVLLGSFIPVLLVFMIILIKNKWLLKLKLDWNFIRPSFQFGLVLLPTSFLLVLDDQVDKFILEQHLPLAQIGVYGILISLVGASKILLAALDNGIRPFLYPKLKLGNQGVLEEVKHYQRIYLFLNLVALSGLILIGCNLTLLSSNFIYVEIKKYVVLACVAMIPLILVRYFSLILVYYKRSVELTISAVVKSLIMISIMWFTVPEWGINGAIFAIGVAHFINLGMFYVMVNGVGNFNVSLFDSAVRIMVFIGILGLSYFVVGQLSLTWFAFMQFGLSLGFLFYLDRKSIMEFL